MFHCTSIDKLLCHAAGVGTGAHVRDGVQDAESELSQGMTTTRGVDDMVEQVGGNDRHWLGDTE